MAGNEPGPDPETLRRLQTLLLRSVLLGEPLPGGDAAIALPDLDFVRRQDGILLSSEHLAAPIALADLPEPLRVLAPEAIAAAASRQGDVAYLRFRPATQEGDTVRLTLEAALATAAPERRSLGLSGVQVAFRRDDRDWRIADPPAAFAQ